MSRAGGALAMLISAGVGASVLGAATAAGAQPAERAVPPKAPASTTSASTAPASTPTASTPTASTPTASTAPAPPLSPPASPLLGPSIAPNLTAASPATAAVDAPIELPAGAEALPKKDRILLDKRARAALGSRKPVTAVGAKPLPILNLFHRWTEEYLPIELAGAMPSAALQNRLLRDHYTNQATTMAQKLIPSIVAAARSFRVLRADIVSGYRHPKYNLILRKKGHQVARDSEHSHGQAVDFRLPGVTTEKLAKWALGRRMGGVGIYLQSQFVHIDVGKVRRWSGE